MSAPGRPTLVYDGDCGFCRRAAMRWKRRFDARIDFLSFDECLLPEAKTREFRSMVRLVGPDGTVFGGARAVAEMFAFAGESWPLRLYRLPVLHWLADVAYAFTARYRRFFGRFI